MTRREEVYTSLIGGTAKKTRFKSSQNAREQREPADACERRDDNAIGNDDLMREYLDNITAASTAKEEGMQEMTCAAKRKDHQLADMITSWQT